jgi:hypothetical protein
MDSVPHVPRPAALSDLTRPTLEALLVELFAEVAALKQVVAGHCHFGPELRRFVLMQYHQGQTTLPRLLAFLRSVGVAISKRQ